MGRTGGTGEGEWEGEFVSHSHTREREGGRKGGRRRALQPSSLMPRAAFLPRAASRGDGSGAAPNVLEVPRAAPRGDGPGAAPKVLEVERAVAFVLKVLRQGGHNRLAAVKRHVAAGKDFVGGHDKWVIPVFALSVALSRYEEEVPTSKPATLPAARAPPSPAAEEPPTADGSRLADSQADEDAASRAAKGQRVVGRGRGVPLKDKFDLNDGNTQLQSYNGRQKDESLRKRGTTRRKREGERLKRQREKGGEDKNLAKREKKRARKDEQGGERAKRQSSSTSSSGESESAEEGSSDDDVISNGKPLLRQTVSPTE